MNTTPRTVLATVLLAGLTSPAMAGVSQRQKLTSTPHRVGAEFGYALAIDGHTMVVGARHDATLAASAGAAYVFVKTNGAWTQEATLLASDAAASDEFGYSVGISGDTVVVGAFHHDLPLPNAGAAYVFVRNGTTWTQQQKLTAFDGGAADEFGNAVGVAGDTIAVGAHHADLPGNSEAGAVYRFSRSGTTWTAQERLAPTVGVVLGDHLGASVAIGGGVIAAGASGADLPETSAGAVYVFVEGGVGSYSLQQVLSVPDGTNGDLLGCSVSLAGNTLVAGAREDTPIGAQPAYGAAYVFEFDGATWTQQQKLTAPDGAMFDRFGWSVSVSGDTIAVGAREDDTSAGPDAGSAYLFTRTGTTWTMAQKLAPHDPFNGDRLGAAVAVSAGIVVVGAAEKNLTNPNGQGAAYVFGGPGVRFDFDGDGKADVAVFRPSDTVWYELGSAGAVTMTQFGLPFDKLVPADYDGDGKTDIAVYRAGTWYLLQSQLGMSITQFGLASDLPVPADYDGDGRADLAVYRSGTWFVSKLQGSYYSFQWGLPGDKPVPADYDGDGRADPAVYRSGTWYLLNSQQGYTVVQFGIGTDTPVVGDYDGDGKTDVAVYRNGTWYLLQSQAGFAAFQFGLATDLPVAADYDGDGKTDVAVYRNGAWFQWFGQATFQSVQFGIVGDKPIPRAFVP